MEGFGRSRLMSCIDVIRDKLVLHPSRGSFVITMDRTGAVEVGAKLTRQVESAIDASDLCIAFLSDAYAASPFCTEEFDQIREAKKPLFLVELTDFRRECGADGAAIEGWRDRAYGVSDDVSCRLWGPCSEDKAITRNYSHPKQQADRRNGERFLDAIGELTNAISERRRDLSSKRGPLDASDDQDVPAEVALALPSSDVSPRAEMLVGRLRELGFSTTVLNPQTITNEAIDNLLSKALIFIQLLGKSHQEGWVQKLHRRASEAKRPLNLPLSRKLWWDRENSLAELEKSYRDFVQSCEFDDRDFEEFEASVVSELTQIRERRELVAQYSGTGDELLIAIDAHEEDSEFSEVIQEELAADGAAKIVHVPYHGREMTEVVKTISAHYHAVILLHGPSVSGQLRLIGHLPYYSKAAGIAGKLRNSPQIAFGDPEVPGKPPAGGGPEIHILRIVDDPDAPLRRRLVPEHKKDFLARVRQSSGVPNDSVVGA